LGKSELAALCQQHWGRDWEGREHPGSWSSTGNAIEAALFATKDALVSVDDYIPQKQSKQVAEQMKAAVARVVRACGNQAGRQRLDASARLKATKPPRGLVLASAEDVPEGTSLNARMVFVEIKPGDLLQDGDKTKNARLTCAQKLGKEGHYAASMAGYLRWLAPRLSEVQARLKARVDELRSDYARTGHARAGDNLAELQAAWEVFLDFAVEVGATDRQDADFTAQVSVARTLQQLAADQKERQTDNDPTVQFLEKIRSALNSGAAHLANVSGGEPEDPTVWGWRDRLRIIGHDAVNELAPQGKRLGWVDGDDVYLDPGAAHDLSATGLTERALWKSLHERGLLVSVEDDGGNVRRTPRKMIAGSRLRVIHLRAVSLGILKTGPTGPTGPHDQKAQQNQGFSHGPLH
jgi:hypothetical protein